MNRHEFIEHGGKRILRLDYTGLAAPQAIAFMQEVQGIIAGEPNHSVRLLSITPREITRNVIDTLKDFAAHNTPFVLASAIVGEGAFRNAGIVLTIVERGRRNVRAFDSEERAKDWLATI